MSGAVHLLGDTGNPRSLVFDNIKGVLILCVLALHGALVWTCQLPVLKGCVTVLAAVVMPGFCFISGHLSSTLLNRQRGVRLLLSVVVLLLWQAIYIVAKRGSARIVAAATHTHNLTAAYPDVHADVARRFRHEVEAPWLPFDIVTDNNPTWFLLCLVTWRGVLPLFRLLRRPLLVTLTLALIVPFTEITDAGQLGSIFGYFPFFMAGHLFPRERLLSLMDRRWVQAATAVFLIAWVAATTASPALMKLATAAVMPIECFYGWGHFEELVGAPMKDVCRSWPMLLASLVAYPVCLCALIGFFSLVPRRKTLLLTGPGLMSMYIYILHPLVSIANWFVIVGASLLLSRVGGCGSAASVALYLVSVLGTWGLLSLPCTRFLCRPLVELPCVERLCCVSVDDAAAKRAAIGATTQPLWIQRPPADEAASVASAASASERGGAGAAESIKNGGLASRRAAVDERR